MLWLWSFAIAIAIYLKNTNNKYFYYLEMSLIIISVVLFNQSLQQRFYSTQGSFDDTCVLGAGEWLPSGTDTSLITDSSHVIYDKNIINMKKIIILLSLLQNQQVNMIFRFSIIKAMLLI